MEKHKERVWVSYAMESAVEALIAVLLFYAIYLGKNIEFVRSLAGDVAISYQNSLVFSDIESDDNYATPVVVYKIDNGYMQGSGLLDEHNEPTYGDLFPRSVLASFIDGMDRLPQEKQPLAFFIDYNMESGSASFDNKGDKLWISNDDKVFLKTLANERHYTILLPKTAQRNFVEEYSKRKSFDHIADKIARKIGEGKIIFVDVEFLVSDHTAYRYNPMKRYENSDKTYYNASLVLWQLRKNGKVIEEEIHDIYDPLYFTDEKKVKKEGSALFLSNILYKEKMAIDAAGEDLISNWKNLRALSARIFLDNESFEVTSDTIVILGHDDKKQDLHCTTLKKNVPGALVHADAIKTVLFLDGELEYFNLYISLLIIFMTFFTVSLLMHYFIRNVNELVRFLIELVLIVSILLLISSYILITYKQWFNWFIPVIIFYGYELILFIRGYWKKRKEMKGDQI